MAQQSPVSPETPASSPAQRRIKDMLSGYITAIRREDYLSRLNRMLYSCAAASPAGDAAVENIQSYYANRPELRNYTLGVELDRDLDYTLILKDGQSLTDKSAIRAHFGYCRTGSDEEGSAQCRDDSNETLSKEELLIRAANQSLLADALAALTGSEDILYSHAQQNEEEEKCMGLILSGPLLSMTSVVEKCHFTVDLQRGKVEAICVLAISVPVESRRLVLARAILIANFRPGKKKPLRYEMKMIKAHHFPRSFALYKAAVSLARDEENLMVQANSDTTAKQERGGPFSLFRFR